MKNNILILLEKLSILKQDPGVLSKQDFELTESQIINDLREQYKQVKSIAIVKLDAIGDCLLFTNSLKVIRTLFSGANIIVICFVETKEIIDRCPYIDRRIYLDRTMLFNKFHMENILSKLHELKFDLLINPLYSREYQAEQIVTFIDAKLKLGVMGDFANISREIVQVTNRWYDYLLPVDNTKNKFELERNAEIISLLGGELDKNVLPELWELEQDDLLITQLLSRYQIGNYAIVFPGSKGGEDSIKYWGKEKYLALIDHIQETLKLKAVILGGVDDTRICNEISIMAKSMPIVLAGQLPLWQSVALVKKAKFYVGSDTSIAHFSAALKVPTIVILGGGHFGRFFPYPQYTSVVILPLSCYGCNWKCKFERAHCVKDIDPELVFAAVEDALVSEYNKSRIYLNELADRDSYTKLLKMLSNFVTTEKAEIVEVKKFGALPYNKKIISLAEEAIQSNHLESARKLIDDVLHLEPSNLDALNSLAVIEMLLKHWATALVELKKVIEIDPNNEVAINNIRYAEQILIQNKESGKIFPSSSSLKISVITPSYNQGKFIEHTIQSVLDQNYPNFQHIIIDGGSSDETIDIFKKYPHLKWISEKDKGQSDALNKGFELAAGEIIAWINSDDWYEPNTFYAVSKFFTENQYKNILMGDCNLVDENGKIFDKVINFERGFEELKNYRASRSIPTQPAIFFRKKLLEGSGLLDVNLKYTMDYDLWMRFAEKNRFFHVDQTFANYRFHKDAKIGDSNWDKIYPECEIVKQRYVSDDKNPLVSVIIPCYNYAKYLPEAVNSVINQNYKNWEIIIVNDGSTDNTVEVAAQIIEANPGKNIKFINQKNSGKPAVSRNRGIAESNGKYVLPLDADDMLTADAISLYLNAAIGNKADNIIVYGWLKSFGVTSNLWQTREFQLNELLGTTMLPYCSMFHRSVWQKLNGYAVNVGYEDWDFWIGAAENGAVFINVSQVTTLRRETGNSSRQEIDRKKHELNIAGIILNHKNVFEDEEIRWAEEFQNGYSISSNGTAHKSAKEKYPKVSANLISNYPDLYEEAELKWAKKYLTKNPFVIHKGFKNNFLNKRTSIPDQNWIMNKVNLGVENIKKNRNKEAIQNFDEVLKFLPELTEVKYGKAVALANFGQVKEARNELEELLKIKPDYVSAREFLMKLNSNN